MQQSQSSAPSAGLDSSHLRGLSLPSTFGGRMGRGRSNLGAIATHDLVATEALALNTTRATLRHSIRLGHNVLGPSLASGCRRVAGSSLIRSLPMKLAKLAMKIL